MRELSLSSKLPIASMNEDRVAAGSRSGNYGVSTIQMMAGVNIAKIEYPQMVLQREEEELRRIKELNRIEIEKHTYCMLCGGSKHKIVDLRNNPEMRQTMMSHLKTSTDCFETALSAICVQCICKLNLHSDVTRQLKMRLQRMANMWLKDPDAATSDFTASAGGKERPSTALLDISTDGTSNGNNRQCTTQPPPTENCQPPLGQRDNRDMLLITAMVQLKPPFSPDHDMDDAENALTLSRSVSPGSAHVSSMLDVIYERPESALITESGGKINKYPVDRKSTLSCDACQRIYRRKDHYTKHIRRCRPIPKSRPQSLSRQSQSRQSQSRQSQSRPQSRAARSHVEDTGKQSEVLPQKRYHCNQCAVSVDSLQKLRDHKQIHLPRFHCETCGRVYTAREAYEFHRVECFAKQEASVLLTDHQTVATQPEQRVTRARSRAASMAATRVVNSRLSVQSYSSANQNNHNAVEKEEEEDDDDDALSETDTMYTKRMHYTDHWLDDHSEHSMVSVGDNGCNFEFEDDFQINTHKEYDLYLLDRLKMQIPLKSITCTDVHCDFFTDNLPHLLLHDYRDHLKKLWFHCKKCSCSFTSKVHLDYHLACQNGGRFICFKCGDIFEFQHQLDRHLIRHTKVVNYHCNYCNFEFLTKAELLQHCDIEQHDPNGERRLIAIDPSMTIVNKVAAPQPKEAHSAARSVRIMEMHLPPMPTKRAYPRPGHKPYRLRVGDVLFKNQKNPNCWGWK